MPDSKKYVYLGPAGRFSPRNDKDGNPEPYIEVGQPVDLSDDELQAFELRGHIFQGREPKPGDPLTGYAPPIQPPPPMVVPGSPESTPGPGGTYGGMRTPTPEEQRTAAENYVPLEEAPKEGEEKSRQRRS
jgi:hypothetical protein